MLSAAYILGGLILLFLGGELLVRSSVFIAKRIGLPPFIIGLTVVAYGTSSPELVISLNAALDGYPDIALGNVIGSNISNILCVIGFTAMVYPITMDKEEGRADGFYMLGIAALLYLLCLTGVIIWWHGLLFLLLLVIHTWHVFKRSKSHTNDAVKEEIETYPFKTTMWQVIALLVVGIGCLAVGGDFLVTGSVAIARMFGWSEAVIGVTLVAFGGSAPELATSIVAAFHKHSDIVIGNVLGSNMFNIMGILGITPMVSSIAVSDKFIAFDLPLMLAVSVVLTASILLCKQLSRAGGALLALGYIAYIAVQFY